MIDKINVITGPMKCGKTSLLIDKYNEMKNKGFKCAMIKPEIDDRFSQCFVVDRNGNKVICDNINKLYELKRYGFLSDVIFIDEFQLLSGNIDIILELADNGKIFYIAGLNLTSERQPFGLMPHLLSIADNITLLTGKCEICGEQSIYTYCEVKDKGTILIGDNEYKSVCRKCYNKLVN